MFEKMTDRARKVVALSELEADDLKHPAIGPEHLLLGMLVEGEAVAFQVLSQLGVDVDRLRAAVVELTADIAAVEPSRAHVPFTPRAKKVLELSVREALGLGHNYVGTEHVLLAIVREGESVGCQALTRLGVDLPTVRRKTIELLSGYEGGAFTELTVHVSREEARELKAWIDAFDKVNGPMAEDHPLRRLRDRLAGASSVS